ncbi:MAG TPA: hypothetical protein VI386_33660 [Candidatus Sulfotelmatobacter sp.]
MEPTLSHQKNPAEGWDISASAKPDKGEKMSRAQIIVNGSSQYDKSFNPPLSSWQERLNQQGQFAGNNTVRLIITNDKSEEFEALDSWS